MATKISSPTEPVDRRFEHFSSWTKLVSAIAILMHVAQSFSQKLHCKGWHLCKQTKCIELIRRAEVVILQKVQASVYQREIDSLRQGNKVNRDSSILSLDPYIDNDGLLRVGGRLSRSSLSSDEKHPIILPGKHHVSKLLVSFFHEQVKHQGRHFTEGAVRTAGFWITGCKRLTSSLIFNCVKCKKLRGQFVGQKMSDLPKDRVEQSSPFSYVGVDVFGPWEVTCRRTRGGQASSKRWAVLFTCLAIRAVHIEIIEDMSSSAFINALRRFVSIRGKVKQFRSDRGTNFVGATDSIQVETINVEDEKTKSFLSSSGALWLFNAPHSSHMGGSWERMIGIARRILESMLSDVKTLMHDVLVTLMAEVSAIINSGPIVPVSYDPEVPEVLTPASLLTKKVDCDQPCIGDLDLKDLYRSQWKRVQVLADQFWLRWRKEYLQSLQKRPKWHCEQEPLEVGDVVLMKEIEVNRNSWPMGRVVRVFASQDGRVRKAEICVMKGDKRTCYIRPVVEMVLLVKGPRLD